MPRNKLSDLNDLLFEELQNLDDPEEGNELDLEKTKAKLAITDRIIEVTKTQLSGIKVLQNAGYQVDVPSNIVGDAKQLGPGEDE